MMSNRYECVDPKCLYGFRVKWVKNLELKLNLNQEARIFCEIKQGHKTEWLFYSNQQLKYHLQDQFLPQKIGDT